MLNRLPYGVIQVAALEAENSRLRAVVKARLPAKASELLGVESAAGGGSGDDCLVDRRLVDQDMTLLDALQSSQ